MVYTARVTKLVFFFIMYIGRKTWKVLFTYRVFCVFWNARYPTENIFFLVWIDISKEHKDCCIYMKRKGTITKQTSIQTFVYLDIFRTIVYRAQLILPAKCNMHVVMVTTPLLTSGIRAAGHSCRIEFGRTTNCNWSVVEIYFRFFFVKSEWIIFCMKKN